MTLGVTSNELRKNLKELDAFKIAYENFFYTLDELAECIDSNGNKVALIN